MTWHGLLKAFSGVPISREFPIPDFFQESGIIENSHFPVPDLFTRDTTLQKLLCSDGQDGQDREPLSLSGAFGLSLSCPVSCVRTGFQDVCCQWRSCSLDFLPLEVRPAS